MSYGTIATSRQGSVMMIELATDDGLNCYTPEMGEDLVEALGAAGRDPEVSSIVLTGRGRAFCAGAHRDVLNGRLGPSGIRIGNEHFISGFATEFAALPKLTIAAFNGSAAGIGVTMSLLCDLRLAAPHARLRLNFADLGILPGLGSTTLLPALVGRSTARKLLLCDRVVDAAEALRIGLVDEVVAADALIPRCLVLGEAASGCTNGSLGAIKLCLDAGQTSGIAEALRREAEAATAMRAARRLGP
jgi:enoyl-CoA hydratase/carnithine racemase